VLFAATWQVVMHTWGMFSGGPGSGLYASRDGGSTWKKVEHAGLPKPPVGKIDVQIAPTNPQRVYALIQTSDQGSLWRSDDGGGSWKVVSWDRALIGRAGYYIRLGVSTANENDLMVANSSLHRSTDGGLTFSSGRGCGDCHDIWIDPKNASHYAVTGDVTHGITIDNGQTFTSVSLPIGQMYHVAADNRAPYWIYSNRQDNGTMRGPSHSPVPVLNVPSYNPAPAAEGRGAGIGRGGGGGGRGGAAPVPWQEGIGGCESGFTIPDPVDPDVVWASCYGNKLTRFDSRRRTARSVAPWMISLDSAPADTKYRCHWTAPLAVDPFDHNTVYYGCQVVFRTSTAGQSWQVISPDLSTQDTSKIVSSGGVVADNLGQFYGSVVFAIAPSSIQRGLIWAGTNDGKIWNTRDGGRTWTDVTKNVPGLPPWGTVSRIEPSTFDAGTAYVAIDFHIMDNRDAFLYKTTDFGATWTKISDGLPKGPLGYVLAVAENPNRRGMLFAGTGNAFHFSMDDGLTWRQFRDGLPPAPVTWIVVQKQHHDVVVSTYGRGLYILHDITRLEQADRASTSDARLYSPRAGFRFARSGRAEITFALRSIPSSPVRLEILDARGTVIRTLDAQGRVGDTRVVWDLRYEGPRQVALRTTPPDNPYIWDEPRFKGQNTRPILHWGIQQAQRVGPLAAPGRYTVRMTVDGRVEDVPLEILKDPEVPSSVDDLAASTVMQIRLRDDLNQAADMVNRLEIVRRDIEDRLKTPQAPDVRRALVGLDRTLLEVELQLVSKTDLHSDDKWFVEAYKVYMNLIWLNGAVGTGAGDEAGGADYRPTDAQVAVLDEIEKALARARADFTRVLEREVPAFNKAMQARGVPAISAGGR
jgi:photosystem II stability/assembly factor-like uncharacterized protein